MSEIGNIADTNLDKLLEKVHLGKLDIVDLHTDEQQDVSEELLGVLSTPADDTSSTSWKAPHDGRCRELHLWMDSCQGPSPLSHLRVW